MGNILEKISLQLKKINLPFFVISMVWFVLTFFTDHFIINFDTVIWGHYIVSKILAFIVLFVGFQYLAKVFITKD